MTSTNPAFIPSVSYTGTNVLLEVAIPAPFALFPFSNFNTAAVGNNIDALNVAGELSPDLKNIFNTLVGQSVSFINSAMEQMHPAPYSAFTELQAELGGQLLNLFHRYPCLPCACANPNRLWVEPFGNNLHMKHRGLEIGFQANTGGIAFGYDGEVSEHLALGLGGAWNRTYLHWQHSRGSNEINGLYGGAYLDYEYGNLYVSGTFLGGMDFYDANRHITFLSTNRHARANFNALDLMAQIRTAYLFGAPHAYFYPYANVDYLYLHTHQINEKGAGGLDLTVRKRTDGTIRSEMGLGFQIRDMNAAETVCISPMVSLGWVLMSPIQRRLIQSTFEGGEIPFLVKGWKRTWNLLNVHFGLSLAYKCYSLDIEYNAEISPEHQTILFNQLGSLRLDCKW